VTPKALIVDPALHSMGGHHYNAVLRLQRELSTLGIDAPCLGSATADRKVMHALACTPSFTRSVYGRDYATPGEFLRSVEETGRQLAQGLRRHGGLPDLLILPCCDQVLAAAVARQLKRTWFAPAPHILLWLLYGPHYARPTDDPLAADLSAECRDAFASLKAGAGDARRIRAYCETSPMAEFYRRLLDLDVGVMPGPGIVVSSRAARPAVPGRPPTVLCIGFANRPKGYRVLPEAIDRVLKQHRHARFMIHGIVAGSDAEGDQSIFDALSTLGERVVVRQDVLTQEEYLACLAGADLVLLPYDRDVYRSRGSGVFTEARTIGIPVVATQGCAFAQPAFDNGWGVAIADLSGEGVALAVLRALDRLGDLAASAVAAGHQAKDDLNAVLQAIRDDLPGRRVPGLAGVVRRLRAPSRRSGPMLP
jgi:glycosyltransferase involved in cell wall biosynthesis